MTPAYVIVINESMNKVYNMYSKQIMTGIILGFLIGIVMLHVPVFHGPDSNDVKQIRFSDVHGFYRLIPEKVDCGSIE